LATLRAELAAFEERYLRALGSYDAALDEIEAQIAEAAAKSDPTDAEAQEKATEARSRADESTRVAKESERTGTRADFQPSETLKKLYREVAKFVHPDLAENDIDRARRHSFMVRANAAYESGDEELLRAILTEWQSSPESVKGDGAGAELVRIIRKIARCEDRLGSIRAEMERIEVSSLFVLRRKAEQAAKEGRDVLAQMATQLESDITSAKKRKARMDRGGRP